MRYLPPSLCELTQAAEPALNALGTNNMEGDALLLSRFGRRNELGRPGDLAASIGDVARGDSESALHIRDTLYNLARDLFLRGGEHQAGTSLRLNFPWCRLDGQEKEETARCPVGGSCSRHCHRQRDIPPLHWLSFVTFFLWLGPLSFSSGPCKAAP